MNRFNLAAALTAAVLSGLIAGCANTGGAGVQGSDAFQSRAEVSRVASRRPVAEFAHCFEARGSFLPFSDFERNHQTGETLYRLRAADWYVEEIRFAADGAEGSVATIRTAFGNDRQWREHFVRDRWLALEDCARAAE